MKPSLIFLLALTLGACTANSAGVTSQKVSVNGGTYTDVWNLKGGMAGWEAAGFPLER